MCTILMNGALNAVDNFVSSLEATNNNGCVRSTKIVDHDQAIFTEYGVTLIAAASRKQMISKEGKLQETLVVNVSIGFSRDPDCPSKVVQLFSRQPPSFPWGCIHQLPSLVGDNHGVAITRPLRITDNKTSKSFCEAAGRETTS